MRKLIVLIIILVVFLALWSAGAKYFPSFFQAIQKQAPSLGQPEKVKVVSEESVVIRVVEKLTPSVVTVGVEQRIVEIDPFDPFNFFQAPRRRQQDQDIGSGFIVSDDGLIVTNKHVVSQQGKYKVITYDGKKYDVQSIYRDPANDISVLKIDASGLKPVELGDSSKIKVGQLVVAIGTPLGEFRGSVTRGIVSGLGRGITTGSPFEGFAEKLDDVIQTDAAINPGNSGGPLVNSSSQVIGVNTAVASGAENIGFAIPINTVKDALSTFSTGGGFSRGYLGVSYRMITRDIALLRNLPEGAFVLQIVEGSPAEEAGIQTGDIITKIDGKNVGGESFELTKIINSKRAGDVVTLTIWAGESIENGKTTEIKVTLGNIGNQ